MKNKQKQFELNINLSKYYLISQYYFFNRFYTTLFIYLIKIYNIQYFFLSKKFYKLFLMKFSFNNLFNKIKINKLIIFLSNNFYNFYNFYFNFFVKNLLNNCNKIFSPVLLRFSINNILINNKFLQFFFLLVSSFSFFNLKLVLFFNIYYLNIFFFSLNWLSSILYIFFYYFINK